MGTNFHWKCEREVSIELPTGVTKLISIDSDDPGVHIGKRSAAGKYCQRCKVTLCKGGESRVHMVARWHHRCPTCLQTDQVQGSCSFSWAQDSATVVAICTKRSDDVLIEDEYGEVFTGAEFLQVLSSCPIVFRDSIGKWFS